MPVIDAKLRHAINVYFKVLERYEHLDAERAVPLMGIRLLKEKYGLPSLVRMFEAGEIDLVEAVRAEILEMKQTIEGMTKILPPERAVAGGISESIDLLRRIGESPEALRGVVGRFARLSRCASDSAGSRN